MHIILKLATQSDIVDIHECNKSNLPLYYEIDELKDMIESGLNIIIISVMNNKINGYMICDFTKHNKNIVHVTSLAVNESFRKLGIGSKMFEYLIFLIKKYYSNINEITLNVHVENETAIRFYKKNGFTIIGKKDGYYSSLTDYISSNDGYKMMKCL